MNVFVTGGSGFIGSHLCQKLSEKHSVVTLVRDLFPTQTPWGKWLSEALNKTTIALGDIQNLNLLKRVIAGYGIDTVVHCAAQAIVQTAQKDPLGTFQTNLQGTATLLEACRQVGDIKTIYCQSTDKVYGERLSASEGDPLVSTGIYETSKSCQDLAAQAFAETYSLNIIIGRASNTYGYDLARRIIPNTIKSCLRGEPPIIFQEEHTLRQYIYVEDLVHAIVHLTTKANGIYNIATDDILTQEQVVRKICNYFPLTPKLVKRDKPLKEIQKQSVNWSKLENMGWKPKFPFEEGIKETIRKFEQHGY